MAGTAELDAGTASLEGLFDPAVVAVVGATEREGSVGRAITENLLDGFEGEVIPVNPNRDSVFGHDCRGGVAGSGADVAVVAVPADAVLPVLEDCGEAGIRNVIVVTAGFGEGGEEGARREAELRDLARAYGLNVVGPNCLGVISTPAGMNASFGPNEILSGSISFLSQSGAFVTAVLDWATDEGIGFRHVVSLGNKAVLDETDFLRYWGDDEGTDVVVGYLEDVEHGRAFVDAAREVVADTPIVLVKAGRTEAGAAAAASHTGAMTGSDDAYVAGFRQAGVLRADSMGELFDAATALAGQPVPESETVAVVTNAGGPGVLATDAVGDSTLSIAEFSAATESALADAVSANASTANPVDVLGDASVEAFREVLGIVRDAPEVGAVVVVSAPTAILDYGELAAGIVAEMAGGDTPVAACLMGGERTEAPAATLTGGGIPCYVEPSRAVGALDALARYGRVQAREHEPPATFDDVDRERAREILGRAAEADGVLGVESMALLDAYGIPTPAGGLAESPETAAELAEELGGAVVMKVVSPDATHKSDFGGVEVGVPPSDAAETYRTLADRLSAHDPDARLVGVRVEERLDTEAGVETIAGLTRDPGFGPLVLFGLGGVFVEVFEDTSLRVAPVSEREARSMTEEIDAAPLLRGARGAEPTDVDALVETLCRLAQLAADFPAIEELDVNPLVALPDRAVAADLRLRVDPEQLE